MQFLGFWPPADVPDLLATLDVAVNCSDFEGSFGRPFMTTRPFQGTSDASRQAFTTSVLNSQRPSTLTG